MFPSMLVSAWYISVYRQRAIGLFRMRRRHIWDIYS